MIDLLRDHYMLLYKEQHALQFTALEQMDALTYLLKEVRKKTLLPCESLEKNFPLLLNVVDRRAKQACMMNPMKRRILLKLYFLRMFTKNVNLVPFNEGDQYNRYGKDLKEVGYEDFNMMSTARVETTERGGEFFTSRSQSPSLENY
jgi:hypothetical protein